MDTVQSSPQRELYEDNPATGSPPSPAGPAPFGENSGVSEYLGQHETLDLSGVTGPSLCPLLTHTPANVRDEC